MVLRPHFLRFISALSQDYLRTRGDTILVSQCSGVRSATYFSNYILGTELNHQETAGASHHPTSSSGLLPSSPVSPSASSRLYVVVSLSKSSSVNTLWCTSATLRAASIDAASMTSSRISVRVNITLNCFIHLSSSTWCTWLVCIYLQSHHARRDTGRMNELKTSRFCIFTCAGYLIRPFQKRRKK